MRNKLIAAVIGTTGIATSEVINQINIQNDGTEEIIKSIIQILIGIITIYKLLKKDKKDNPPPTNTTPNNK